LTRAMYHLVPPVPVCVFSQILVYRIYRSRVDHACGASQSMGRDSRLRGCTVRFALHPRQTTIVSMAGNVKCIAEKRSPAEPDHFLTCCSEKLNGWGSWPGSATSVSPLVTSASVIAIRTKRRRPTRSSLPPLNPPPRSAFICHRLSLTIRHRPAKGGRSADRNSKRLTDGIGIPLGLLRGRDIRILPQSSIISIVQADYHTYQTRSRRSLIPNNPINGTMASCIRSLSSPFVISSSSSHHPACAALGVLRRSLLSCLCLRPSTLWATFAHRVFLPHGHFAARPVQSEGQHVCHIASMTYQTHPDSECAHSGQRRGLCLCSIQAGICGAAIAVASVCSAASAACGECATGRIGDIYSCAYNVLSSIIVVGRRPGIIE